MNKTQTPPSIITIFGATGNLSHLKLIPSLYELDKGNYLPDKFSILAVARRNYSKEEFIDSVKPSVEKNSRSGFDDDSWEKFAKRIDYYPLDFTDREGFKGLRKKIDKKEEDWSVCFNRIFYLSTPPSFFKVIFEAAKEYKLNVGCSKHDTDSRIVIEKPFGTDLQSAKELNKELDQVFKETQIYRIDHFLAKETVQNILAFRFANEIFEPIFNKNFVDHIQITQFEDFGIGTRGGFYEEAGALRDMMQNHLLQLLAVVTMNHPARFDAASIRKEKVELLKKVKAINPEEVEKYVVRGQYGKGKIDGKKVKGYTEEEKVADASNTETFVAAKFMIDNHEWKGIPVYIKHGKRMKKNLTQITIVFKETGHTLFDHLEKKPSANILTFQIKPDEGIGIRVVAKKPGLRLELTDVDMEFCYASAFRGTLPDPYERVLLDIMVGDQTLFPHVNEVLRSWEIVDSIVAGWEKQGPPKFPNYEAGSWGPKEADQLIEKDGRSWLSHELSVCQIHFR